MNNNTLYNSLSILNKEIDGIVAENIYFSNLIKDLEKQIYYYKELYDSVNKYNYNLKNIITINNFSNKVVWCLLYNDVNDLNDLCIKNNDKTSSILGINKTKYTEDRNYPAFILHNKYKHDVNCKDKTWFIYFSVFYNLNKYIIKIYEIISVKKQNLLNIYEDDIINPLFIFEINSNENILKKIANKITNF